MRKLMSLVLLYILGVFVTATWTVHTLDKTYAQSVPQAPDLATTVFSASSGNVAAGTAAATLAPGPGTTGQLVYICGFAVTSTGSTATAIVSLTVTGLQGGTQTYTYVTVAGVTAGNAALIVNYNACIQANNSGVSIVVSLPSLGAGSTNATVNAWGFRR